jgi:hypothetical protein
MSVIPEIVAVYFPALGSPEFSLRDQVFAAGVGVRDGSSDRRPAALSAAPLEYVPTFGCTSHMLNPRLNVVVGYAVMPM